MKYYSEPLNRLFDDEKSLIAAEAKKKREDEAKAAAEAKAKSERAAAAKEVDALLKEAEEAYQKAVKALKAFTKKYGYYHTSFTVDEKPNGEEMDVFDDFLSIVNAFLR